MSLKWILILFTSIYLPTVQAQEAVGPKSMSELTTKKKIKLGWTPLLKLGATYSFGSSDSVIGQVDGDSTTVGLNVDGALNYRDDLSEFRNELSIVEATTRNPSLPRYVKSNDSLKFNTIYLRSLKSTLWLGPYARAGLETTLFKGEEVRQDETTFLIARSNGSLETVSGTSIRLTDAFSPLTTKESVGFFAKAIDEKTMKLEFRLGVGAVQVNANGSLNVDDDSNTAVVEIKELESFDQVGLESGIEFSGSIDEKTSYSLKIETLTPFTSDIDEGNECDDCSDVELTNLDLIFKLSSKLYDWVSLNYEFSLKKQPQLLNRAQIQHLFLLNFSYALWAPDPEPEKK